MKQIINKEDKAVSPIIATILLIAITVVLAATLYTVLGGFTKGLSTSGSAAVSGSFVNASTSSHYNYTFTVSSSSTGGIAVTSLVVEITTANGTYKSGALSATGNTVLGTNGGEFNVSVNGTSGGNIVAGSVISVFASSNHGLYFKNAITSFKIIDTASNSIIYTS